MVELNSFDQSWLFVAYICQIDSPTIAVLNLNISQNYLLLNLQHLKVFVQLHLPSKEWRVKVNVQRKRKAKCIQRVSSSQRDSFQDIYLLRYDVNTQF